MNYRMFIIAILSLVLLAGSAFALPPKDLPVDPVVIGVQSSVLSGLTRPATSRDTINLALLTESLLPGADERDVVSAEHIGDSVYLTGNEFGKNTRLVKEAFLIAEFIGVMYVAESTVREGRPEWNPGQWHSAAGIVPGILAYLGAAAITQKGFDWFVPKNGRFGIQVHF